MSYAVKEMFLTLQGEGVHAGRRAVFLRFAGCNLWTGREEDRRKAVCQFCDTDFVGTDGDGGGKFADADALADAASAFWGEGAERRYIVLTGGEPMLQVDDALIEALHARGFTIAIESNGTIAAHPAIISALRDWLSWLPACVPISDSAFDLVTIMPVETAMSRAGICDTRPSPMVSSV